jgi:hypothetical protein
MRAFASRRVGLSWRELIVTAKPHPGRSRDSSLPMKRREEFDSLEQTPFRRNRLNGDNLL